LNKHGPGAPGLIFQRHGDGQVSLKPGVTLHMYTSSQPCGNASLKRWAKSKTPVYLGLGALDLPQQVHERLHTPQQAVSEGQVRSHIIAASACQF
jgi:double-stranded RNA-specific adenosine deaminase